MACIYIILSQQLFKCHTGTVQLFQISTITPFPCVNSPDKSDWPLLLPLRPSPRHGFRPSWALSAPVRSFPAPVPTAAVHWNCRSGYAHSPHSLAGGNFQHLISPDAELYSLLGFYPISDRNDDIQVSYFCRLPYPCVQILYMWSSGRVLLLYTHC